MELGKHSFFSIFPPQAGTRLTKAAEIVNSPDGTVIFEEGADADSLYLVLAGTVELVKKDPAGQKQVLTEVGEGEYFGEFGILDGRPRSAGAVCRGAVTLARISRAAVNDLFRDLPGSSLALAVHVIEKMRRANELYAEAKLRHERMLLMDKITQKIVQDFKRPFSAVRISAFSIDKRQQDEATHKLCQVITEQVERMERMIQEVLAYSRGQTQVNSAAFNVAMLLKRYEEANRESLAEQHVTLTVPEGKPLIMEGDQEKLLRVLQNLTNYSVESMGGRPGQITVGARQEKDDVFLELNDNGPALPPQSAEQVFDPFSAGETKEMGSLGMAMARAVVEAHRGRILVESGPLAGKKFAVVLPVHQKKAKPRG